VVDLRSWRDGGGLTAAARVACDDKLQGLDRVMGGECDIIELLSPPWFNC
jgi:hypothetical protein